VSLARRLSLRLTQLNSQPTNFIMLDAGSQVTVLFVDGFVRYTNKYKDHFLLLLTVPNSIVQTGQRRVLADIALIIHVLVPLRLKAVFIVIQVQEVASI